MAELFSLQENWDRFTDGEILGFHENKDEILSLIKEEISFTCLNRPAEMNKSVTEQAKSFLREHYREQLSMEMLAAHYHLNPRYFFPPPSRKGGRQPYRLFSPAYVWRPQRDTLEKHGYSGLRNPLPFVGYEDPPLLL